VSHTLHPICLHGLIKQLAGSSKVLVMRTEFRQLSG